MSHPAHASESPEAFRPASEAVVPAVVAVDWGSSSFRLWILGAAGEVIAESRSDEGMLHCSQSKSGFAPVLGAHLLRAASMAGVDTDGLPILICGMAGARQGWFEAPYADLPARVSELSRAAVRLPESHKGELAGWHDIRLLPGLAQRDLAEPDVMRGEETQLLGLVLGGHEGLVCMPGTHCKWSELKGGAVTSFRSWMTGELFSLLSRQSILRHAMPEPGGPKITADDADFLAGLDVGLKDPASIMGGLFGLRAAQLLDYRSQQGTLARLSGLLIGAEVGQELGGKARPRPERVVLLGQEGLGALYHAAIRRAGIEPELAQADEATRQGLLAAAREIWSL